MIQEGMQRGKMGGGAKGGRRLRSKGVGERGGDRTRGCYTTGRGGGTRVY